MTPDLHARLKELDQLGEWESPAGFDFRTAAEEILSHKSALEGILGCSLKTDAPQDAAFIADVFVLDPRLSICIRFSAFDRMFTIFGTELARFSEQTPVVIGYLREQGFKYVSDDDLKASYDGVEPTGTEGWTWFTRFFDYL